MQSATQKAKIENDFAANTHTHTHPLIHPARVDLLLIQAKWYLESPPKTSHFFQAWQKHSYHLFSEVLQSQLIDDPRKVASKHITQWGDPSTPQYDSMQNRGFGKWIIIG